MAFAKTDQNTFVVRVSNPEPQTIGCQMIPGGTTTDTDGTVHVTSWIREVAVLIPKVMVVEQRGHGSRPEVPVNSSEVLYNGNFHFESKSVSFEAMRINEANMWRIVKTVTIKALYVNGSYIAGKKTFETGDDTI